MNRWPVHVQRRQDDRPSTHIVVAREALITRAVSTTITRFKKCLLSGSVTFARARGPPTSTVWTYPSSQIQFPDRTRLPDINQRYALASIKVSTALWGRREKVCQSTTRHCDHHRWKVLSNRHCTPIVSVCNNACRGKLERGREPWVRCFPTHILGFFDCFSGPMLSRRSLEFLLTPSFTRTQPHQCLSEDQPASGNGEAVSRGSAAPVGKAGASMQ